MIKDIVKYIQSLSKTGEILSVPAYSTYGDQKNNIVIFTPDKLCSEEPKPYTRRVRSIKSLFDAVMTETQRFIQVENEDIDHQQSVIFNETGAIYNVDDIWRTGDTYIYERPLSQQWLYLKETLEHQSGGGMNLVQFLIWLQGIAPSVIEFEHIFSCFQSVKLAGNIEVNEQPLLSDGKMGESYDLRYSLSSANSKVANALIPSEIHLLMPYVKNGKEYKFKVCLMVSVSDKKPWFRLACPLFESIEEQAIDDEYNEFIGMTENMQILDNLMILR